MTSSASQANNFLFAQEMGLLHRCHWARCPARFLLDPEGNAAQPPSPAPGQHRPAEIPLPRHSHPEPGCRSWFPSTHHHHSHPAPALAVHRTHHHGRRLHGFRDMRALLHAGGIHPSRLRSIWLVSRGRLPRFRPRPARLSHKRCRPLPRPRQAAPHRAEQTPRRARRQTHRLRHCRTRPLHR
jgi:hypothetical protein